MLGVASMTMLGLFTIGIGLLLFPVILLKLLTPEKHRDAFANPAIVWVANRWLDGVIGWLNRVLGVKFEIDNHVQLSKVEWYMIVANHQSWVDIFALFYALRGQVPLPKFFIKKELMYVPVVGQAWWALDYPFMQRHSREVLAKNPEKANDDLEATRKACAKFQEVPTSIVNFLEGTRFTAEKQARQKSPFKHLLRPKAGGLAFAIQALGKQFSHMIDATIYYPGKAPSFWDMACGRVGVVKVELDPVTIPDQFLTMDYVNKREDKLAFQGFIHELWLRKDEKLAQQQQSN